LRLEKLVYILHSLDIKKQEVSEILVWNRTFGQEKLTLIGEHMTGNYIKISRNAPKFSLQASISIILDYGKLILEGYPS